MATDLTPTDAELLMRFRRHGEAAALAELVHRHAALVLGICRQTLRHQQDAEDVFQATFLILVRRAHAIRGGSSIAGWLYRVAYHTALRQARRRTRQRASELTADVAAPDDAIAAIHRVALVDAMHEELAQLPAAYRDPLVLCYLEGKTRRAAAAQLETTDAAIKARLVRGRSLLRVRLARRGVGLSLALAALPAVAARAADPALEPLVAAVLAAATGSTASAAAAGANGLTAVSKNAITLAQSGARAMLVSSSAKWVVTAGCLGLLAVGWAAVANTSAAGDNNAKTPQEAATVVATAVEADAPGDAVVGGVAVDVVDDDGPVPPRPSLRNATFTIGALTEPKPPAPPSDTQPVRESDFAATSPELPDDSQLTAEERTVLREALELQSQELEQRAAGLMQLAEAKRQEAKALEVDQEEATVVARLLRQAKVLEARGQADLYEADALAARGKQSLLKMRRARLDAVDKRAAKSGSRLDSPTADAVPPETPPSDASPTPALALSEPTTIRPGSVLHVEVLRTLPEQPIDGDFRVEESGTVALGAAYGRVKVGGLSIAEAEVAIRAHLAKLLTDPQVQVTFAGTNRRAADGGSRGKSSPASVRETVGPQEPSAGRVQSR